MKIFIDSLVDEEDFVSMLIRRLKIIKYEFSIDTWETLRAENKEILDQEVEEYFEMFDIIIAVVTSDFLASDFSNTELNKFAKKEGKHIIPIIYYPTSWASISWIVKSKIFPETDNSFCGLPHHLKEPTLNSIVKWVENIISKTIGSKNEDNKLRLINEKSIFISHSHEDAEFAELLHLKLEKSGISCWIDSERLKIGQEWRQEIDDGITNSIATIAIITPEAKKSEYVTYEWAFAWGRGKKIFPIMLKQTGLHPRLESLQYLDFTNRNSRPWDKLIDSIKELMEDN